ncbi:MAG TPA: DUF1778 domain-containing protein [Urbifossiella sp.]|nr:DUF1778 domain-containing protein [Urbifossiella sp.]
MSQQTPEIRVTDSKARLTLPRAFANATLLLEVRSDNEILIRKAKVVPVGDSGDEPETITLSSTDWAAFLAAIENPPKANPKLKKLLRDYAPSE